MENGNTPRKTLEICKNKFESVKFLSNFKKKPQVGQFLSHPIRNSVNMLFSERIISLDKIILRNQKAWLQIQFLVFTSLPGFLTKQTEIKNKNLLLEHSLQKHRLDYNTDIILYYYISMIIIMVLSRYDCRQFNFKLRKKEYRILVSKDN